MQVSAAWHLRDMLLDLIAFIRQQLCGDMTPSDVSEKDVLSPPPILRLGKVEISLKFSCYRLQAEFLLNLYYYLEVGGDMSSETLIQFQRTANQYVSIICSVVR